MKKFMKRSAILAAGLILSGLIISLISISQVGMSRIDEVVAQSTDGRIHMNLNPLGDAFGVYMDEAGFSVNDGSKDLPMDSDRKIYKGDVEKIHLGNEVSNLWIDMEIGDLICLSSEDRDFAIEAKEAGRLQAYVEDNTLYIKVAKDKKKTNYQTKVTLYVPSDVVFDTVEADMGAGNLQFGKINTNDMNVYLGAGDFTVEELRGEDLNFEIGMGNVQISRLNASDLQADVGMGNFEMHGTIHDRAKLECGMGDLKLWLEGQETDYNYEIDAAMGNVTIGEQSYGGLSKSKTIDHDADKNLKLQCGLGNLEIHFVE